MVQLVMRRPNLLNLPEVQLTDPQFRMRGVLDMDLPQLSLLLHRAFPEIAWSEDKVFDDVLRNATVHRTFVVLYSGTVIATASSQYLPTRFPDAGVVHWVAADPRQSRKGLGRAVTTAVLHDFVSRGRKTAALLTDDFRLAAIRVYLELGFEPDYCDATHPERWAKVYQQLNLAAS